MRKQSGITLISLTIYVIALSIVVAILATISGFFYKNVDDTKERLEPITQFANFNSFFVQEIEKTNIKVKYCTWNYIIFTDTNTSQDIRYVYIPEDKAIYRDTGEDGQDNKSTFKVARGIENCSFEELNEQYTGKAKITAYLSIGDKTQTYTYMLNN